MTGPYKEDGSGTLWVPNRHEENTSETVIENLEQSIKASMYNEDSADDEWLGGYNKGDFELEELYVENYDEPEIVINGTISGVYLGLSIPVKNNKEMQKIVEKLNKVVTIDKESSGLYLKPKDFTEVRTRKADPQGRINLGKEYADKEIRVVVMD
jgi:hypothetical protein